MNKLPSESTLEVVARALCEELGFIFITFIDSGRYKETYSVKKGTSDLALKICKPDGISARTEREINAMQKFDNPHIVKLYGIGTYVYSNIHYVYFLEEFLHGGSLQKSIDGKVLSKRSLLQVSLNMVSALKDMRQAEIVHRDIKPDNIMFRDKDKMEAVLVDFGLVRMLGEDSLTQTFFNRGPGTPMFASPEQLNNEKELIDWRSDQFSLGVTLYYAFYNRLPFSDKINLHVDAVARRDRLPADIIQRLKTDGLEPIIKMLSSYPIERYFTPELLADDLRKVVI